MLNLLGGSWVVINEVIIRVTILLTHVRGLITPLVTTHEPPSRCCDRDGLGLEFRKELSRFQTLHSLKSLEP